MAQPNDIGGMCRPIDEAGVNVDDIAAAEAAAPEELSQRSCAWQDRAAGREVTAACWRALHRGHGGAEATQAAMLGYFVVLRMQCRRRLRYVACGPLPGAL